MQRLKRPAYLLDYLHPNFVGFDARDWLPEKLITRDEETHQQQNDGG